MSDDGDRVPVSVAWILLAALAAALFLTSQMRSPDRSTDSEFPASANGLDVISIADAIEVQRLEADTDVAVSGWYQGSLPIPCPAPEPPVVAILNGDCSIEMTWLMSESESILRIDPNGMSGSSPTSPAIHPVFDGPDTSWARPLPATGDAVPTPVVFIGHFNDARAAGCRPEDQPLCRERLVVTVVAWADGVENP
ncbi:MAG: hypothetical protein AB1736_06400 [Chloroflexota bacterium]